MKHAPASFTVLSVLVALGAIACGGEAAGKKGAAETADAGPIGPCGSGTPSGFLGDENCILPPSEEEGLQIHIGPTSYDDPGDKWVVQPGGEPTEVYHTYASNTDMRYFFQAKYRMRTGSHHMIISVSQDTTSPEGWTGKENGNIIGAIAGTQHVVEDFPPGGKMADEDQGLATQLQPHQALDIQLHFYNTREVPLLREAWVNFYYKPQSEVTQVLGYLGGFVIPLSIAAHTTTSVGGTCDYSQALPPAGSGQERIVSLFGHTHSHTTRFFVNKVKADGTTALVYDSYDWSEAATYTFNSLIQNPAPNADAKKDGAFSGDLILQQGEKLTYQCDITNDTDNALTFKEKVDTGEMCNLFGTVVGSGFPCFDLSRVTGGSRTTTTTTTPDGGK